MRVEEIKDIESLKAWLATRPESDGHALVQRAKLRIFPLWAGSLDEDWAVNLRQTALPLFRQFLCWDVERRHSDPRVKSAARLADGVARVDFQVQLYTTSPDGTTIVSFPAMAVGPFLNIPFAKVDEAIDGAISAFFFFGGVDFWKCVQQDAIVLLSQSDLSLHPLWPERTPETFETEDNRARAIWARDPQTWAFWVKWWDAVIAGTPLDWELQKAIALEIPEDTWKDPKATAEAILVIEGRFALARTDNGERLEVNPETGLVRLVGKGEIPEDIATYARRKMAKALRLFEGKAENQYSAIGPALKIVVDAIDDAACPPIELFDACASSTRMVANLVRNEVVPRHDQDALIGEYVTIIREAAADILSHDAKTQAVLERRNRITGNTALAEAAGDIRFVVGQLVEISEGTLARALPRDVDTATHSNADAEDRKDSSYRLSGRILRFGALVVGAPIAALGAAGAAIEGWEKIISVIKPLMATPQYQQALAAILRWLGLG